MPGDSKGYLPLPDYLTVKKSKLHGLGIFAAKDIPADEDLGITHVADKEPGRFPNDSVRTPLGGFINHSSDPNSVFYEIDDTWRIKTLRKVRGGEEITAKYDNWYDDNLLSEFN